MFCKFDSTKWSPFHAWNNWEHYERQMTQVTWDKGHQEIGLKHTEHWQKRTCSTCGFEQRRPIHKDGE
jgi:hypothetical protein